MTVPEDPPSYEEVVRQAAGMARSLRVLGVCFVLMAVPYAATGYGLLVAWAPVWLGVLLWQAANVARMDEPSLHRLMHKLRRFFVGFSLLVIGMFVVSLILVVVPAPTLLDVLARLGL